MIDPSGTGIGGWLIPLVIATFLRPAIWAWGAWQAWQPLSAFGPRHPANALLTFEFVSLAGLAVIGLWTIILMLRNQRLYAPVMVALWAAAVLFAVADALWVRAVVADPALAATAGPAITSTNWQVAISAGLAVIGIPYLLRSQRLRRTFTE